MKIGRRVILLSEPEIRSDEDLARETQAGSLGAFEELVSRYERRVYSFLMQQCRNPADARELTQDTFVKAFQAIARFNPRRSFAGWLFIIARRKCIDRQRAARPRLEESPLDPADARTPAEVLGAQDEAVVLWELARRCLPERQLRALWFRYAEDMSVAEIAQVMRITRTHVKVLLFRARVEMARQMNAVSVLDRDRQQARDRQFQPVGLKKPGLSPM